MRIIILFMGFFAAACSVLGPEQDKIAEETGRILVDACKNDQFIGGDTETFFDKVNKKTSKESVTVIVDCGD